MSWKQLHAYFWASGFGTFTATGLSIPARITCATLVFLILFILPLSAYAFAHLVELDKATSSLLPAVTALLCTFKYLILLRNRHNFVRMIGEIRRLLATEAADRSEYKAIVRRQQWLSNLMCEGYRLWIELTVLSTTSLPLFVIGYDYLKNGGLTLMLPFPGSYPYDHEGHPVVFVLTYAWNFVGIYCAGCSSIMIDTLFAAFAYHICALFQVAQRQIELLDPHSLDAHPTAALADRRAGEIFHFHQRILEIVDELNVIFRPVVFGQFFISSLQLCMLGFQLERRWGDPNGLVIFIFAVAILTQVLIYSYSGDLISNDSQAFATAVYSGYWYELEPQLGRSFLMPMARAQRPSIIDGYFFRADLPTFTSLINTAMSYVALLRSFEE